MNKAKQYGNVIDFVDSPDDGGWYAQETNVDTGKSRVTKRIYQSEESCRCAVSDWQQSPTGRTSRLWEPWS